MLTIVHGSDLHFGKPFHPEAARAFKGAVEGLMPDLLVLSGDFTQRAKVREYEAAREYLKDFRGFPVVVTPGNHDVPLYRVWERLLAPHRNYREYISQELDSVTRVSGATVVALNSTAPHSTIVNGRIRDRQLRFAAQAFLDTPEGDARIVVAHHHLAPAPDYESDQVMPGFRRCLDAFTEMKVDLILGGHLHRGYIGSSLDVYPGEDREYGIVIAHSGTTSSRRGRARERLKNTFNLVRMGVEHLEITHHMYFDDMDGFVPFSSHVFPRREMRFLRTGPLLGEPALGEGDEP
jgi:3',5'-cyclic AMP phosphodiesterase CpdA